MNSFIRPIEGNNTLWRYFFAFLVMVGLYVFGNIAYLFAILFTVIVNPNITFDLDEAVLSDPLVDLYLSHVIYLFAIPGVWLAVRFILKYFPNGDNTKFKDELAENFLWFYCLFLANDRRTID